MGSMWGNSLPCQQVSNRSSWWDMLTGGLDCTCDQWFALGEGKCCICRGESNTLITHFEGSEEPGGEDFLPILKSECSNSSLPIFDFFFLMLCKMFLFSHLPFRPKVPVSCEGTLSRLSCGGSTVLKHLYWLQRFVDANIAWLWFLLQRLTPQDGYRRTKQRTEVHGEDLKRLVPFHGKETNVSCAHTQTVSFSSMLLRKNIMSPIIFPMHFFLSCMETFSLGLEVARQFPGIVHIF